MSPLHSCTEVCMFESQMPPKKRIHVGCIVSTPMWRFGTHAWVTSEYGARSRSAKVEGTVVEASGRSKWKVQWDWAHPDPDKREGESPSSHLTIVRSEIEQRRRTVREGMSGGGANDADDDDDEEEEEEEEESRTARAVAVARTTTTTTPTEKRRKRRRRRKKHHHCRLMARIGKRLKKVTMPVCPAARHERGSATSRTQSRVN